MLSKCWIRTPYSTPIDNHALPLGCQFRSLQFLPLFSSVSMFHSSLFVFGLNFKKKTVSTDTVFCPMSTLRRYSSRHSQAYVRNKQRSTQGQKLYLLCRWVTTTVSDDTTLPEKGRAAASTEPQVERIKLPWPSERCLKRVHYESAKSQLGPLERNSCLSHSMCLGRHRNSTSVSPAIFGVHFWEILYCLSET